MTDINIVLAGAAGEGIQTIGQLLSETLLRLGYASFAWQEFESRIRGGQNSYSLRISETAVNAPRYDADILLALNRGALTRYHSWCTENSLVLTGDADTGVENAIHVPFRKIAREEIGNDIYANTVAIGALAALLGVEAKTVRNVIERRFAKKSNDILKNNAKAVNLGFHYAEPYCNGRCQWNLTAQKNNFVFIDGNQAAALASVYAGCKFIAAYPMSPATGIITYLSKNEENLAIFTEQAEDEIAAVNLAIGASFAGARAMTATSGGGFALMTEGVSLAGMTETPLVIVIGQRPGPATGLPTRTSQGDLLFALHAGHGEFPKLVLAPADPSDMFHKVVKAFNLADKYQLPAIILMDQFLADSSWSFNEIPLDRVKPEDHLADPMGFKTYKRYQFQADGISPRLFPGQSRHLVGADSDEHDESGHITEDLQNVALRMMQKRLSKQEGLRLEIDTPEHYKTESADTILVSWGSTRSAVIEGVERLRSKKLNIGAIHFTEIHPLPELRLPDDKTYISVECNATGQFEQLLKSAYGIRFAGHVRRCDGLPLSAIYLEEAYPL